MTEISIREKEKWTNKQTDKQEMADSFLHNTTYHIQGLYQISTSYVKQFLRNLRQKFPYSSYEGRSESSNNCLIIQQIFIVIQEETYLI